MIIKSIQKVIKVGSSLAVTIPAKDAQFFSIKAGENLEVNLRRPEAQVEFSPADAHSIEVVELTQKLIKRHAVALKNLSQR